MNKEQFIDTLQACYFGDRGAFNKIVKEYKELKERIEYLERSNDRREDTIINERDENIELSNKIDKAINYIEEHTTDHRYSCRSLVYADELLEILNGDE